jgi:Tetracyclin repressor-like, C-terminal domain
VEPAAKAEPGLPRIEGLCEGFLSHIDRGVFPGGCFFASVAAELDTRPGPVRDRIAAFQAGWAELVASELQVAKGHNQLDPDADVEQLTFEINAMLAHANAVFLLQGERKAFDLARRAIRDQLGG